MTEAGLLQADGKWASFTARARVMPGAADRTVLVIVDGGSPMSREPHATIDIQIDDGRRFGERTRRRRIHHQRRIVFRLLGLRERSLYSLGGERHGAQPDARRIKNGVGQRRGHGGAGRLAGSVGRLLRPVDQAQPALRALREKSGSDSWPSSRW